MNILSELTKHLILASRTLPQRVREAEPPVLEIFKMPPISEATPFQTTSAESRFNISNPGFIPSTLKKMPLENSLEMLTETSKPWEEFGKISSLISDQSIGSIICDGPLRALKIKKGGKSESTAIALDKSEIDSIVNKFSEQSHVPIKPVFRASIGNISILALISPAESRFLITRN